LRNVAIALGNRKRENFRAPLLENCSAESHSAASRLIGTRFRPRP
jgi:hypothetical protein